MATEITLKHPKVGITKKGFIGFSWTMFLFGFFVPLSRGDTTNAVIAAILQIATFWLGTIVWSFFYNKQYTNKLIEAGYEIVGDPEAVRNAKLQLGIAT